MSADQPAPEWDTDRVLTIPNVISFVRLLGIPLFGYFIIVGHDMWAVVTLAVFGATDWIDGWLARKLRQRTKLGARLDPVADRLYILMAIIALFVRGIVPWWLLALLVARDVVLTLSVPVIRRATGQLALPVNNVGKAATMLLLFAFPLMLIGSELSFGIDAAHWAGWACAVAGAVLYWVAGGLYLRTAAVLAQEHREALNASP